MRGIRLTHGAIFVEKDGVTVKISRGKCSLSPILFDSLEWDLRTEPPHTWEYMTEGDIRGLGEEIFSEITNITNEVKRI